MAKSVKKKEAIIKEIVLTGSLSLGSVGEVRTQLQHALSEADTVKILLQDIEDIDLSIIQIICSAHRTALLRNKALILQSHLPAVFIQIIEESGLQGHIGCSHGGKDGCVWGP